MFLRRLALTMTAMSLFGTLVTTVTIAPARSFAQAAPKIAFVDLEYALNNVEEGKKAKAVLEQDFKRKKDELDGTRAKLTAMETELKSQTLVLSDDVRRQKEAELAAAVARYDADLKAARDGWQKKEASLTRDLLERLTQIVQQMGKDGNYTFILERHDASVLYAQANVDLTKQVIERFNKSGARE